MYLHREEHFTATDTVRDIVIGMSDGLTVPFALAAGLSGAVAATSIVVTAGLAEIAAGSIAMGLGGYLAARTDAEHYRTERQREVKEVERVPHIESEEVAKVFRDYGLTDAQITPILEAFRANPTRWVDFMMQFELGLDEPDPSRAVRSALTIALSYIAGGFIPLLPYLLLADIQTALLASVGMTLVALLLFGYLKGRFTGTQPLRSGIETLLVGGVAAATAFTIARLVG